MKRSIPRGILLLARGKAQGLAEFDSSREAFLASLAPWIAFPLVASLLHALRGGLLVAAEEFLATLCALLAPPVITEWVARRLQRERLWLRFATAFNWSQWALPPAALAALFLANAALGAGLPVPAATYLWMGLLGAYALWLHWFLLRRGLALSAWGAAGFVVVINLVTAALVMGPQLLQRALLRG